MCHVDSCNSERSVGQATSTTEDPSLIFHENGRPNQPQEKKTRGQETRKGTKETPQETKKETQKTTQETKEKGQKETQKTKEKRQKEPHPQLVLLLLLFRRRRRWQQPTIHRHCVPSIAQRHLFVHQLHFFLFFFVLLLQQQLSRRKDELDVSTLRHAIDRS